jgi:hypothetical protein
LQAKRVPELDDHFQRASSPQVRPDDADTGSDHAATAKAATTQGGKAKSTLKGFCSRHRNLRAAYVCATCGESYCSDCCNRFGNVKLCPDCGTMCLPYTKVEELDQIHGALNRPYARKIGGSTSASVTDSKFTFAEILTSIRSPFTRPLTLGGRMIVFAILSVLSAAALAEEFVYLAVSVGSVLAIAALLHSMTAFALDEANGSTRRKGLFWHSLHTIRTAAASLTLSFGPFIVLVIAAMVFAWFQFSGSVDLAESQMISAQNQVTRFVSEKDDSGPNKPRFNTSIEARRENLANSFFGISSGNTSLVTMTQSLMRLSVFFLLPIGGALLIAVLLFPAACVNSITSESTVDRWNPLRPLRLIRSTGFEYVKLLSIAIVFTLLSLTIAVLAEQATELMNSIAAAVVVCLAMAGALFAYFWSVFSRLMALVFAKTEMFDSPDPNDFHVITQIQ